MPSLQLFSLAVVAALIGVSNASCFGRPPRPVPIPTPIPVSIYPDPCYCGAGDDLSALLLLAKATEKANNEVNVNDLITNLLNALIVATGTGGAGGAGGVGGAGGTCGCTGTGGTTPSPNNNPALIDLSLLTPDQLAQLLINGEKILNIKLGGNTSGGLLSDLLKGLV